MHRPRASFALGLVTVASVTSGCGSGQAAVASPPPPTAAATSAAAQPAARQQAAVPVRVRVDRVGIDSPVIALAVLADGQLETPTDFSQAGWWRDGPEPGEIGPAVIAAHVDSAKSGPAAFYRLRDVEPGDTIRVDRADGSAVSFAVTRRERHSKSAFPTRSVYGTTPNAALRLITCGGSFDRKARSYLDNIVVYADLIPAP